MSPKRPARNAGQDAGRRQTLAAAVIIALLLLGGWWLMSALQGHNDTQNCIASGRRDCVPVMPDK